MAINNDTPSLRLITDAVSQGKKNSYTLDNTNMVTLFNGSEIPIRNIFRDKHRDVIMENCFVMDFDQETYEYFRFQPKLLSLKIYGTIELWHLLLWINDCTSVTQFDKKDMTLFDPSQIGLLNSIIEREKANITANHKSPEEYIDSTRPTRR